MLLESGNTLRFLARIMISTIWASMAVQGRIWVSLKNRGWFLGLWEEHLNVLGFFLERRQRVGFRERK